MLNRLKLAEERYLQLEVLLAAPDATAKADAFRDLMKEYNELLPKVEAYRAYSALVRERASAEALYNDTSADKELRDLAFDEMQSLDGQIEEA